MKAQNFIPIFGSLLAMLLLSALAWSGTWTDNFDDGKADGWEIRTGVWEVEKGEYHQSDQGNPNCYAFYNPPEAEKWTDYTVEVKVKPVAGPYVGVAWRVQEFPPGGGCCPFDPLEGTLYDWLVGTGTGKGYSQLWKFRKGDAGGDSMEASDGNLVPLGKYSTLTVVLKGDNIKCYLNNTEEKNFTDKGTFNGAVIPSGGIGVKTYQTEAYFDDVSVTAPNIGAVEPALKLATSWGLIKLGL